MDKISAETPGQKQKLDTNISPAEWRDPTIEEFISAQVKERDATRISHWREPTKTDKKKMNREGL